MLILLVFDYFKLSDRQWHFWSPRVSDKKAQAIRAGIDSVLTTYHFQKNWILVRKEWTLVRLPKNLNFVFLFSDLVKSVESSGGAILDYQEDLKTGHKKVTIGVKGTVVDRYEFKPAADLIWHTGKVAIIIDDFGNIFSDDILKFLYLPQKITISIIPGLSASARVANEARLVGKEVMVHLPMEPREDKPDPGQFTILTKLNAREIAVRTRLAIQSIPHARGINNHQGSKATANRKTMEACLKIVKEQGLYFIDSNTSPESVAYSLAKQLAIPTGVNNLFLDAEDDETFIRKQFDALSQMAASNNNLIAIAHPRKKTLAVFEAELPKLEKRGIHFNFVSELIQ